MPMDNDDAVKREGVEPTYKRKKGFAPLQMSWGQYIIDAVFRGGSKHSNHGDTVSKMVKHVVNLIRKRYDIDVVILIRCDSGFFDQKLMEEWESLGIAYIMGGKIYDDIHNYVYEVPIDYWDHYKNEQQVWDYLDLGDCRGSWKKFRRMFYCHAHCDDDNQLLLSFARPDTVIYTNLGVDEKITDQFRKVGQGRYLKSDMIIESYHQRGRDELVNRALKDFGTERLPFKRFTPNTAFYYIMLVSFFLYESFKEDVGEVVLKVTSYATTLRRIIIDTAAKVISSGWRTIVKFFRAVYEQIRCEQLWERALHPPPIFG